MKNMCKKNTLGKILILVVAAWHLVILMRLIRWCEIEHQDWKIHALLAVSYLQKKRVPIHCYICQFPHEKAKSWEIQSSLYVSSANACILFPCILQVDNREMLQKYSWTKKKKRKSHAIYKKKTSRNYNKKFCAKGIKLKMIALHDLSSKKYIGRVFVELALNFFIFFLMAAHLCW